MTLDLDLVRRDADTLRRHVEIIRESGEQSVGLVQAAIYEGNARNVEALCDEVERLLSEAEQLRKLVAFLRKEFPYGYAWKDSLRNTRAINKLVKMADPSNA